MSTWDPSVVYEFKYSTSTYGNLSAGAKWDSPTYETAPNEVLEVYRVEVVPPVSSDGTTIEKIKYIDLLIDGSEYGHLRINSVMMPAEHPNNAGAAVDLCTMPYLHAKLAGRIPTSFEGCCPKIGRGRRFQVRVVADSTIDSDFKVILRAARVVGESKLVEILGPAVDAGFRLDSDMYAKTVPVSLDTFDELPGGTGQSKPQVFPWVTYARNAKDTTANQWYSFDPSAGNVAEDWMKMWFNLVNRDRAYLVNYLGVIPHTNSKALRLYVDGRITNPEYPTYAYPGYNTFYPAMYYDVATNNGVKSAGPVKLKAPFLFHGVKGGIQILDSGTSIPANGAEVHVYGVEFVLR
jgi:hypothetical protein